MGKVSQRGRAGSGSKSQGRSCRARACCDGGAELFWSGSRREKTRIGNARRGRRRKVPEAYAIPGGGRRSSAFRRHQGGIAGTGTPAAVAGSEIGAAERAPRPG